MKNRNPRFLLAIICSFLIALCQVSIQAKNKSNKTNLYTAYDGYYKDLLQSSIPDIFISEIMYNSPSTDDEWIEICNVSGSSQTLDGLIIKVNGTIILSLPPSTIIPDQGCITVALGDNEITPFNTECPFEVDYGNPSSTNTLNNSSATIELWTADDINLIDLVTYSDSDGADGNGASLHVIDATIDNSTTASNWQEVATGGSPGSFNLISPCSTPVLQLKNSSGRIQACDSFTLDFGSVAVGFSTELEFIIENDGSIDLQIDSFSTSGDFSIVSPQTPLSIASGENVTVRIRFSPRIDGNLANVLTINNNDPLQSACSVILAGIGYLPVPEIKVEGDIGSFPDINNGDTSPSGVDNTLFASQFIGSSQTKGYIINNIGSDVLEIMQISILGPNPADFNISLVPLPSVDIGGQTYFEVSFSPLAEGQRNATVSIEHNDLNNNPFTFSIRGTGICSLNDFSVTPSSGPPGTTVKISGIDLTTSSVFYDEVAVDKQLISTNETSIVIPKDAKTSHIKIVDPSGCEGYKYFEIFKNISIGCEGGSYLNELFISEVTDAAYGSLTYIELFNPTANTINLGSYSLSIYPNGKTDDLDAYHQPLNGIIAPEDVFVITSGTDGLLGNAVCNSPGGDGSYGDFISSELPGINKVDNKHDFIGLYKNGELIDAFGVFGDKNWMNTLPTNINDDRGFVFNRSTALANLPSSEFQAAQWEILDWKASGSPSCDIYNYSNIGFYDYSTAIMPSISNGPTKPQSNCQITPSISVVVMEGFLGGNPIKFEWYYNIPDTENWIKIDPNDVEYSGQNSHELIILKALDKHDFQFYVQVMEDSGLCSVISHSVQIKVSQTKWNGQEWNNNRPDKSMVAVIEGPYNTNSQGSISACNLYIKKGGQLLIEDNSFVDINEHIYIDGDDANGGILTINPKGILVQTTESGKTILKGNARVEVIKRTAPANRWYEYTYWSSPVEKEFVDSALQDASPKRRFYFSAQNFKDSFAETNNNNQNLPGQDGIDDDNDSWLKANGLEMVPGVGYISTHDPNKFGKSGIPPFSYPYIFKGPLNNGEIKVPIYRNDAELNDRNWNLIGNPYPSPISVDSFIEQNESLEGILYFWSQGELPSSVNNGSEALNFGQNNYAIINGVGEIAGGDKVKPNRFIPSGQGFFVTYSNLGQVDASSGNIKQGTVIFNNSMRTKGTMDNNQFFKRKPKAESKYWLNLSSETGLFSQTMVAYCNEGTEFFDGYLLDAPKDLSPYAFLSVFTKTSQPKDVIYAIQTRDILALQKKRPVESIDLGYYSRIPDAELRISLDGVIGDFFKDQDIYLKDKDLGILHNLNLEDYIFISKEGYFDSRFEIIYLDKDFDDIYDPIDEQALKIIEIEKNQVRISNEQHRIDQIDIMNLNGQAIYSVRGSQKTETISLNNLMRSVYIARVKLANNQIIVKKFLKTR